MTLAGKLAGDRRLLMGMIAFAGVLIITTLGILGAALHEAGKKSATNSPSSTINIQGLTSSTKSVFSTTSAPAATTVASLTTTLALTSTGMPMLMPNTLILTREVEEIRNHFAL